MKQILFAVLAVAAFLLAGCSSPAASPGNSLDAFEIDNDPYLGNVHAEIQVVAFEAPACSACRHFHNNVLPRIEDKFIDTGSVAFYTKQWYVGYEFDRLGGVALECTFNMGGSEPYYSLLAKIYGGALNSGALQSALHEVGEEFGLDQDDLFACHDNPELDSYKDAEAAMERDFQVGVDNGALSSPAFFIISADGVEYLGGNSGKLETRLQALV